MMAVNRQLCRCTCFRQKSLLCRRFDYVREHRERGVTVIFANPSKKVVRQLEDARLVQHIGALSSSSS